MHATDPSTRIFSSTGVAPHILPLIRELVHEFPLFDGLHSMNPSLIGVNGLLNSLIVNFVNFLPLMPPETFSSGIGWLRFG
jgi:hypothetical protein